MNNSEQTPYNRHGLKLYCKEDNGNPIQFPKPDSKKNTLKSKSNKSSTKGNNRKKQQFWKYDDRHIDQYDLSEFHPECGFIYGPDLNDTDLFYPFDDSWDNPRYQHTPCLDAGWIDCKCYRCQGCIYPKQNHICTRCSACSCRDRLQITTIDLNNGGQYDYESYSDDDQDSWSERQKYNTRYFNDINTECGNPSCRDCYPYSDEEFYYSQLENGRYY